jgi:hypothetical protein
MVHQQLIHKYAINEMDCIRLYAEGFTTTSSGHAGSRSAFDFRGLQSNVPPRRLPGGQADRQVIEVDRGAKD